jgi:hypothetical protein
MAKISNLRFGVSDPTKYAALVKTLLKHSGYFLEESNLKDLVFYAKEPLVFYDRCINQIYNKK